MMMGVEIPGLRGALTYGPLCLRNGLLWNLVAFDSTLLGFQVDPMVPWYEPPAQNSCKAVLTPL